MAHRKSSPQEKAFLAEYQAEGFERPSVTVDVAVVTLLEDGLGVLLVQRDTHPFKGDWALPGGFVGTDESLEDTAARVLRDKAGLQGVFLEQLQTMGAPDRDPRTRVISVAYYALVDPAALGTPADGTAILSLSVPWEGERGGTAIVRDADGRELALAFDHAEILGVLVKRLRGKLDYAPIGYELLPRAFTLRQLQDVHEAILGRHLNKDSFRRRILASGLITPTGKREQGVGYRPAQLYRFKKH